MHQYNIKTRFFVFRVFKAEEERRFRFSLSTEKYINSTPLEYKIQKNVVYSTKLKILLKIHFFTDGNIVCVKLSIFVFFVLLQGWARATLSLFIIVLCSAVSVCCVCVSYNKASWASLGCATQQPRRTRVYLLYMWNKTKKAALITLSSSIHLRNVYRASMASSSELLLSL